MVYTQGHGFVAEESYFNLFCLLQCSRLVGQAVITFAIWQRPFALVESSTV